MSFDNDLIASESEDPTKALVVILEDHKKHIKSHLRYFYRKGMIKHIVEHIKWAREKKKQGLPTIEVEDFLK